MHDIGPALAIIFWLIATIAESVRRAKKPPGGAKPSVPPPVRPRVVRPIPAVNTPTGYAGRQAQSELPEHARAIDSAGSRLASGAEYPTIVAERQADRLAEERFAAEVRELEASEPQPLGLQSDSQLPESRPAPFAEIQNRLSRVGGENGALLGAIVLAEVLGRPKCRR